MFYCAGFGSDSSSLRIMRNLVVVEPGIKQPKLIRGKRVPDRFSGPAIDGAPNLLFWATNCQLIKERARVVFTAD